MKRVFLTLLTVCLLLQIVGAESEPSSQEITGFNEKINAMWLTNCFDEEAIEKMDKEYMDFFLDEFWNSYLPATKSLGRMKTDSDEEELKYELEKARINYKDGFRASLLNCESYLGQYATNGTFYYLFSPQTYWYAPTYENIGRHARFNEAGHYITDLRPANINYDENLIMSDKGLEFIKNSERLKALLLKVGVTSVSDIKIFDLDVSFALMYIRCDTEEYFIKLRAGVGTGKELIPQIKLFQLYPVTEVLEALLDTQENDYVYRQRTKELVEVVKPTFDEEAVALQSEGLLNGNEKGLDLLKPLTRIEATAMLVRALGLEDGQTASTSYFTDIPDDNWGMKYANIAAEQGITQGVGENKFAPNDLVTDNQFATLVLRAAGEPDFDWQQAIQRLIEKGVVTAENAKTMDLFTRGDMAKILYEARGKGLL